MRLLLPYLVLAVNVQLTVGARILAVLPIPAKSHHILFRAVLSTLAQRGHQVISYTAIPLDKTVANYTEIVLQVDSTEKMFNKEMLERMMDMSPIASIANTIMRDDISFVKQAYEKNEAFKKLFDEDNGLTGKYDLVILEAIFAQEVLLGLGHKFNAPVVNLHPFGAFSLINKAAGNPLSLSYIPDVSLPHSDHMSFYERTLNTYSVLKTFYIYYTRFLPSQELFMRELFKDPTMPPLVDMIHNISMFITNAHPRVHYSEPYSPNLVPVGGIHLSRETNPLPPDIKKFLDEATNGVIYMCMGSILPDNLLPQVYFENFINIFRKLPQRVLWKTSYELKGLPDNVLTARWMPQQDILAHPSVIVFMTHGGIFGQHEAINAGVPVICTPYFGDQAKNAKFYEDKGIGITLPFKTLSERTIYSAITTILNNPKYRENMQKLSGIYRDSPQSPTDNMVFWVEYVMRHRGAPHLRPVSATLSWYQLALLDVLAAIVAALVAGLFVLCLATKTLFGIFKKLTKIRPSAKKKN